MKLSMIVAVSNNNCIGTENVLPWNIPSELKYFQSVTMGSTVIVGSKTLRGIGRILPGREIISMTKNRPLMMSWLASKKMLSVRLAEEVDEAKSDAKKIGRPVFIIGGAKIYNLFFDLVDTIYLTRVDVDVEGDAYFPVIDEDVWLLRKSTEVAATRTTPKYVKQVYTRTPKVFKMEMY